METTSLTNDCRLAGIGNCGGWIERHHILSKGWCRGNKEVRKYMDAPENIALLCKYHHDLYGRDTGHTRGWLLRGQAAHFGELHMRLFVNGAPWEVWRHEDTWEVLSSE